MNLKLLQKIICLTTIILLLFIIFNNFVNAVEEPKIILEVDNENPKQGELITLTIYAKNLSVAAGTLWIYFNTNNLELVEKPDNSNMVNNSIIYTWFSENGKNENGEFIINKFIFKAKNDGINLFTIQTELYNEQGEQIKTNIQPVEITIGEINTQIQTPLQEIEELQNDDENNTNLAILRLNQEGINPIFNKNIKEYYIIVPEDINNIEVTAVPENKNSKVSIKGNQNLKSGENNIKIKVESENGKKNSEYQIYVTKTNDINASNANLENLAIEGVTLQPDYQEQVTNYTANVANDVDNLNILAVPQNKNAKANISGNYNLKQGDNIVTVTVTAENGNTIKKYKINVHKMSEEEQKQEGKNENIISSINEAENNNLNNINIDNSKEIKEKEEQQKKVEINNNLLKIGGIILVLIAIGIIIIIIIKKKK